MKRIVPVCCSPVPLLQHFYPGVPVRTSKARAFPSGCTSTPEKTYIIGIDAEYPPYRYLDPNGTATGFDVESMRWIPEKKGLKVTFQPTAWDGMIPSMDAGKIDIVYSGMTITPERAEKVNFSIPYLKINQSIAVPNSGTKTLSDFSAGKMVIGAQQETARCDLGGEQSGQQGPHVKGQPETL